jgi:hypothetical protein
MTMEERLAALPVDADLAESPLALLCIDMLAAQERFHAPMEPISRIADGYQSDLRQTNHELVASSECLAVALSDIPTLRGFIPICSSCKKVRDDRGFWIEVETYLTKHCDVVLGSSVCPGCSAAHAAPTAILAPIAPVAAAGDDEADTEQKNLAAILADRSTRDHPLRGDYQHLSLSFQKLVRRLNKISRISDGFQA